MKLDEYISRLRKCEALEEHEVKNLCDKAREILVDESNVQRVDAPVTVRQSFITAQRALPRARVRRATRPECSTLCATAAAADRVPALPASHTTLSSLSRYAPLCSHHLAPCTSHHLATTPALR